MRQSAEFGLEDRLGAWRHQPREGLGLGGRLVGCEHDAVEADEDGQGGEDRQQGVEADPADVEAGPAVLGAMPRPPRDAQHRQRPVGGVVVELGELTPIHHSANSPKFIIREAWLCRSGTQALERTARTQGRRSARMLRRARPRLRLCYGSGLRIRA